MVQTVGEEGETDFDQSCTKWTLMLPSYFTYIPNFDESISTELRHRFDNTVRPGNCFERFFDEGVIEMPTHETNIYAQ